MFTNDNTCYGSSMTLSAHRYAKDVLCVIGGTSAWFQASNQEPKT